MDVNIPEEEPDQAQNSIRGRIEVIAVILLALATIGTAWSGYQAARWGGQMSLLYSSANTSYSESVRLDLTANQVTMLDIQIFIEWLNATAAGNNDLATFYRERMRPEEQAALDAWLAQDPLTNPAAPKTPFSLKEYVVPEQAEAEQFDAEAAGSFAQAQTASMWSDSYVLNSVILAMTLFAAGMVGHFKGRNVKLFLVILSLAAFAYGFYRIIVLPIF